MMWLLGVKVSPPISAEDWTIRVCRHTHGMVYYHVFSGMRVTVETQVLRFPMVEVDWPHKAVGIYSWDHSQGVQLC
jgi:hypothetical protein